MSAKQRNFAVPTELADQLQPMVDDPALGFTSFNELVRHSLRSTLAWYYNDWLPAQKAKARQELGRAATIDPTQD